MRSTLASLALTLPFLTFAQDDLLSLLGPDSTEKEYVTASFKTTRVINSHSLENTAGGVLDFKIGHRFGTLEDGISNFYGLDQATIRLGLDYGITDRIMARVGLKYRRGMYHVGDGDLRVEDLAGARVDARRADREPRVRRHEPAHGRVACVVGVD